ncbi:hypothetical protein OESDEN_14399 [Oesophagostomum dentatum]|uniref:Uncharacterized protein n=1 Tax=Oesophagostomum dentatum TaxID=61180 RepID=A0A0B1SRL9_OESDE|nr:hypothetical protein OESDEN_14399 [Oesophagostomum dentatum]
MFYFGEWAAASISEHIARGRVNQSVDEFLVNQLQLQQQRGIAIELQCGVSATTDLKLRFMSSAVTSS